MANVTYPREVGVGNLTNQLMVGEELRNRAK